MEYEASDEEAQQCSYEIAAHKRHPNAMLSRVHVSVVVRLAAAFAMPSEPRGNHSSAAV